MKIARQTFGDVIRHVTDGTCLVADPTTTLEGVATIDLANGGRYHAIELRTRQWGPVLVWYDRARDAMVWAVSEAIAKAQEWPA